MLGNALATTVLTITGTRIVGPFVGGILIFTLGFFWNFTIEACLYLVNVALIFRLRTPYHTPGNARQRGSAMSNMIEGLRYVWSGERAFFQLMVLSVIPNIILHPSWFLFPVFHHRGFASRRRRRRLSAGSNRSRGPAGGAHHGDLRVHFPQGKKWCWERRSPVSVTLLVFAFSKWMALAFLFIAAMAFSQAVFRTARGTLIQTLVPDSLRGRMTSLQSFDRGFLVVASLGVGILSDVTSPSTAMAIIAVLGLAASGICWAFLGRVRRLG